ncbi:MAG TPA: MbnP family protein [Flavitalea sp.]|nr:MbnP family protein [Flavitalea sp.]
MKTFSLLLLIGIILLSCKKENNGYNANFRGLLGLEFDNVAGSEDLKLITGTYTNASGETFSVRNLQYFISNISLVKTDGTEYIVPQDSSYFMINESASVNAMPVLKIPEGEYKELRFIVGVDSLRNTMDISKRTGVLAPTLNNYFNENNGYIFFNMEGTSPQAPGGTYKFHIGGYGGKTSATINNIKKISIDLSARGMVKIREGNESVIHMLVDVTRVFTGTTNVSLATNNIVEFHPFSVNIANNYALMYTHDHTHN